MGLLICYDANKFSAQNLWNVQQRKGELKLETRISHHVSFLCLKYS